MFTVWAFALLGWAIAGLVLVLPLNSFFAIAVWGVIGLLFVLATRRARDQQ